MYSSNKRPIPVPEWASFHQLKPSHKCQDQGNPSRKGKCRNPRCSLVCRYNWAMVEASMLIHLLHSLPTGRFIYFGNLEVTSFLSNEEHLTVRSQFRHQLNKWAKTNCADYKLRATSEIGDNLRIHTHYCIHSNKGISHADIKRFWTAACDGRDNIVDHDEPRKGIEAAAKYMFKFTHDAREGNIYIRLLNTSKKDAPRAAPQITWGSKRFYPKSKKEYFEDVKQGWLGDKYVSPEEFKKRNRPDTGFQHEVDLGNIPSDDDIERILREQEEEGYNSQMDEGPIQCVDERATQDEPQRNSDETQVKITTPLKKQVIPSQRCRRYNSPLYRIRLIIVASRYCCANSRARPPPTAIRVSVRRPCQGG